MRAKSESGEKQTLIDKPMNCPLGSTSHDNVNSPRESTNNMSSVPLFIRDRRYPFLFSPPSPKKDVTYLQFGISETLTHYAYEGCDGQPHFVNAEMPSGRW